MHQIRWYTQFVRTVVKGIINYTEASSAPTLSTREDRHSYVSMAMATVESLCGCSRDMLDSYLRRRLSILLLFGIR
jgi:hypothetical protein